MDPFEAPAPESGERTFWELALHSGRLAPVLGLLLLGVDLPLRLGLRVGLPRIDEWGAALLLGLYPLAVAPLLASFALTLLHARLEGQPPALGLALKRGVVLAGVWGAMAVMMGFLLVLFVVPGLYMAVLWGLVTPVVVLEGLGPDVAAARSEGHRPLIAVVGATAVGIAAVAASIGRTFSVVLGPVGWAVGGVVTDLGLLLPSLAMYAIWRTARPA